MLINKEGKLFGKVSIIDIFVVIVIVIAAFGVYTRFFTVNEKVTVTQQQIEYRLKVTKVRQGTVDALSKLGPVYDSTTKEYMGELVAVETEDCYEEQKLADGTLSNSKIPDRMNVIITVRVNGSTSSTGYYTSDNKYLAAGSGFVIATKYAETTGEIISINEIK